MNSVFQIKQDFIVINPDKKASIEPADSTLYERIDTSYNGFSGCELIACYEFESDWQVWEVHPHGDEIVMLLRGEITFILQTGAGETRMTLKEEGQYLVVPQGVWHTAKTQQKSKVLFITPGQGTQHRAD